MNVKRLFNTIRYCMFFKSADRAKFVRDKKIFGAVGEGCFLPFMVLPLRSENIVLHNNIEIASGVKLVPHDAIHGVFQRIDPNNNYQEHIGRIEIMDNVFVGANSIILGPATIGPNVVIAAGAVVCGDVPEGSVVGGVPAKRIGDFFELMKKRKTV